VHQSPVHPPSPAHLVQSVQPGSLGALRGSEEGVGQGLGLHDYLPHANNGAQPLRGSDSLLVTFLMPALLPCSFCGHQLTSSWWALLGRHVSAWPPML
jgi:hypothetical protein